MTLWHKKLIIFCLKIFTIIGLLLLLGLFLYYRLYFKKDNLAKYVPADSLAYLTFKADKHLLENSLLSNIAADFALSQVDLTQLNGFVSNNVALAIIPQSQASQVDYLAIINLKFNANLDSYYQWLERNKLSYQLLTNNTLERNILVISNSKTVIGTVVKLNHQEISSLADNINVMLNLQALSTQSTGKVYFNFSPLYDQVEKIPDLAKKLIVSDFKNNKINQLYLNIQLKKDKIIMASQDLDLALDNDLLMETVPADLAVNLSFINSQKSIVSLIEQLKQLDQTSYSNLTANQQYLANLLSFDWSADIWPLLEEKSQLIVDQAKNYIIALQLAKNANIEQLNQQLDKSLSNYLAWQQPIEEIKELPDYSKINQIVKKPQDVQVQSIEIANFSLKILSYNDQEFLYFVKDNVLFLTNSSQLITKMLSDQTSVTKIDQLSTCFGEKSPILKENLLLSSMILPDFIKQMSYFDYLNLREDISQDKIWLCLEKK